MTKIDRRRVLKSAHALAALAVSSWVPHASAAQRGHLLDPQRVETYPLPEVQATLIIHDEKDAFVPLVHAQEAKTRLQHATLSTLRLSGHIIWLGREARRMHDARIDFLRRHG